MGEIVLENGMKGILTEAGKESEEPSFFELLVNGRKFGCSEALADVGLFALSSWMAPLEDH